MAAKTRGRNKKEDLHYDPLAEKENMPKPLPKKRGGKKKVGVASEKVPASPEVAQATSQGDDFTSATATISQELDASTTDALDKSLAKMLAINAKTTKGTRQSKEARKNKVKTAAAKSQSKILDSIREEAKEDDTSVATPKISNTNGEEVEQDEEVDVKDKELKGNPILKQYSTFTLDELDSVNYHQMEDNEQPQGSGNRFSGRDLMKFILSTTNKYCLMIYIDPHLHLLHSAFRSGDSPVLAEQGWMISG